jgi:hypothetical protein
MRATEQGAVVRLSPDVFVYRRLNQIKHNRRLSAASRDE